MVIGVDFDNTIVCYDGLFHRVALESGLIPATLPLSKDAVRDYLRSSDKEDLWTELQGHVYGKHILEAEPFSGVEEFFLTARRRDVPICVISHKTRHPFAGPPCDLHEATYAWLRARGFVGSSAIGLSQGEVFLEISKENKLDRIRNSGCTHFIDDLPEFLLHHDFPGNVERLLFDPHGRLSSSRHLKGFRSWRAIRVWFFPKWEGTD